MKIIGIAGGSGSGKSTVSYQLVDAFPDKVEVLNLDDYQRVGDEKTDLPTLHGMVNWDHPDIIRWEKLLSDVKTLQDGQSVTIKTWSHRSNPDYDKKILIPMHFRYVEPTKKFADIVLDASKLNQKKIFEKISKPLFKTK